MKAALIKKDDHYFLQVDFWYPKYIKPSIVANTFDKPEGDVYQLSKQNCDEIFGIVDVEKLAKDFSNDSATCDYEEGINVGKYQGYLEGFNKAMELNKDKKFTLGDMKRAFNCGRDLESIDRFEDWRTFTHFINSLQPKEIEVEIEMETCSMNPLNLDCDEIIERPKLDSDGCLILKPIR